MHQRTSAALARVWAWRGPPFGTIAESLKCGRDDPGTISAHVEDTNHRGLAGHKPGNMDLHVVVASHALPASRDVFDVEFDPVAHVER